jgi:hypothetical protein
VVEFAYTQSSSNVRDQPSQQSPSSNTPGTPVPVSEMGMCALVSRTKIGRIELPCSGYRLPSRLPLLGGHRNCGSEAVAPQSVLAPGQTDLNRVEDKYMSYVRSHTQTRVRFHSQSRFVCDLTQSPLGNYVRYMSHGGVTHKPPLECTESPTLSVIRANEPFSSRVESS